MDQPKLVSIEIAPSIQNAPVQMALERSLQGDGVFVPPWLYQAIQQYYDWAPRPTDGWGCKDEMKYQSLVMALEEVESPEDFDLLLQAVNHEAILEEIQEIEDKCFELACEVRGYYLDQKRERQKARAEKDQEYLCILCLKVLKLPNMDVCASCRKEHWKEEQRLKIHLYRARKASTPATLTLGQWISTLKRYNHQCAYCTTGPYEVLEHYIPISAGGGTTQENCVPSCRSCNNHKRNEHPENI